MLYLISTEKAFMFLQQAKIFPHFTDQNWYNTYFESSNNITDI